jgi:hypothetical protein
VKERVADPCALQRPGKQQSAGDLGVVARSGDDRAADGVVISAPSSTPPGIIFGTARHQIGSAKTGCWNFCLAQTESDLIV